MTKIRAAISEIGSFNALLYAGDRALGYLGLPIRIEHCHLHALPVATAPLLPAHRAKAITVALVAKDDPRLLDLPLDRATLSARRKRDEVVCFGAFEGDRLLACHWITVGPHEDEQYHIRFIPLPQGRAAWDFDLYICPERRGTLVFARFWDGIFAYLRDQGIDWLMSYVAVTNVSSRQAHQRLGSTIIGHLVVLRVCRWEVLISTLRPFLRLSSWWSSRPSIYLAPRHASG